MGARHSAVNAPAPTESEQLYGTAPRYRSTQNTRTAPGADGATLGRAHLAFAAPPLASCGKLLPIVGGCAARSAVLPASFGDNLTVATARLTVQSPTRRSLVAVMRGTLGNESASRGGSPIPFTPRPRSRDITTASVMAQHVGALGGNLALGAAKARDSLDRKASAGVIKALPRLLPSLAARPSSMQLQPGAPVDLEVKRPTSARTLAGLLTKTVVSAAACGDESVTETVVSAVRATAEERLVRLENRLRSVRRRAAKKVKKGTAAAAVAAKKAAAGRAKRRSGAKPSAAYAGAPFIKPTLQWKRGKAPTYDYKHSV